jgi:hypothetical protein
MISGHMQQARTCRGNESGFCPSACGLPTFIKAISLKGSLLLPALSCVRARACVWVWVWVWVCECEWVCVSVCVCVCVCVCV